MFLEMAGVVAGSAVRRTFERCTEPQRFECQVAEEDPRGYTVAVRTEYDVRRSGSAYAGHGRGRARGWLRARSSLS